MRSYSLTCPACKVTFPTRGAYMNHGRGKRSTCTDDDRFWARVDKSAANGCWVWTGYRQKFGHGSLGRSGKGDKRTYVLAHRHAWELLRGPIPPGKCLLHHCDNPPCVNPEHLYLGDRATNNMDKVRRNRQARGETARSRLTEAQVLEILRNPPKFGRRWSGGSEVPACAMRYGVEPGAIYAILAGRSWKHLSTNAAKERT